MAKVSLSQEQYQDARDTFEFLDTNKDGRLEMSEFCNGLSDLGVNLTIREIRAIMDHFGKESHESLTFEEYLGFYYQYLVSHDLSKNEVLDLFRKADLNKDGFLSIFELKGMMVEKGEYTNEDDIHSLFKDYDTNRDCRLSVDEFINAAYNDFT